MNTIHFRYSVLTLLLLFYFVDGSAQNFHWANQAKVKASTHSSVTRLKYDALNNYYICGSFDDTLQFDSLQLIVPVSPVSFDRGYIAKYNTNGHVIYAKKIDGLQVVPYDMAVTSSGTVYLAGNYMDSLRMDHVFLQTDSPSVVEGFILKLDLSGKAIWGKRVRSFDFGMGLAGIALDSNEDVIVTGYFRDSVQIGTQTITAISINGFEILLAKLDSAGNTLWMKNASGRYSDQGNKVTVDDSGNIYVTGSFIDTAHFDSYTIYNKAKSIFVAKYNAAGNAIWAKAFGGKNSPSGQEAGTDIVTDPYGNIGLAGLFTDTASFGPDTLISPPVGLVYYTDVFTAKLDASGNVLWAKQGRSPLSDNAVILSCDDSGSFYIAGQFNIQITFDGYNFVNTFGGMSYFVKYDSSGNINYAFTLGGQPNNSCYPGGFLKDHNGDIIAAVMFSGNAYLQNIYLAEPTNNFRPVLTKGGEASNLITGKVFFDWNGNAVFDSTDFYFQSAIMQLNGSPSSTFYNNNYYLIADTGIYDVRVGNIAPYTNAVPASYYIQFSGYGVTDSLNDFALVPDTTVRDIAIQAMVTSALNPGQTFQCMVNYTNHGWTTANGFIEMIHDSRLTYSFSGPPANFQSGDTLRWYFSDLLPQETRRIHIHFFASALNLQLGDTTVTTFISYPVLNDSIPVNNYDTLFRIVGAPFDPNAKSVLPEGDLWVSTVQNGTDLNYTIQFQNTGTDTAFTVFIYDTLSQNLDWSTFRMTASSHPCSFSMAANGFTEFRFDGIRLPDSVVNEPASHGFVSYTIRPLTTLQVGQSIENTSYIYFDANPPIQTNTTYTEVIQPVGIESSLTSFPTGFLLYPNPTNGLLVIKKKQFTMATCRISIFDLYGKLLYQSFFNNRQNELMLDVSPFSDGIYFIELSVDGTSYRGKMVKQ